MTMEDSGDAMHHRLDWGRGPFASSPQAEALRQTIIADPYDDTLREAYAALAIEQGHPRGEYIRLGLLRDTADRDLQRSIDEAMEDLRARYGRAIYGELFESRFGRSLGRMLSSPCARERAGFIVHYEFAVDEPLDLLPLAALTPLESVKLMGRALPLAKTKVRDVAYGHAAPTDLRNPRRLHVMHGKLPTTGLGTCQELHLYGKPGQYEFGVATADAMPELRSLHLHAVDESTFEAIAQMPGLESLSLAYGLPRNAAEVFRKDGNFAALQSLTIVETAMDLSAVADLAKRVGLRTLGVEAAHDLSAFFSALSGAKLQELQLYGYPDGDMPLSFAPFETLRLDELRSLALYEYHAEPDMTVLARSPAMRNVDTLILSAVTIDEALAKRLAETELFEGIREFLLSYSPVGDGGLEALARNPHFQRIERLTLRNVAAQAGVRAVFEHMTSLSEIDIGPCPEFQPLRWFADMPHLRTLRKLRGTRLGGQAAPSLRSLASAPHAANLRVIDLPSFRDADRACVDAFIESPYLASLGHFPIHDELEPQVMDKLLRRFGHRIGLFCGERRGPLPEPDLDPWWT